MSRDMAVVRLLPVNNESAADDSHDKLDLPQRLVSLMVCENGSKVQNVYMTRAGRIDEGANSMTGQLGPDVQRRRTKFQWTLQLYDGVVWSNATRQRYYFQLLLIFNLL